MENIKLELTHEEVDQILNILSQVVYKDVYQLINKIHSQGKEQLDRSKNVVE